MADTFKLHLPADAAYRTLVPDVAGRYAELSGGSEADAAALTDAVTSAVERVLKGAGSHGNLDLFFQVEASGVRVDVNSNGHKESVRVRISVAKS
jgi:hypothetical protein